MKGIVNFSLILWHFEPKMQNKIRFSFKIGHSWSHFSYRLVSSSCLQMWGRWPWGKSSNYAGL